MTQPAAPVNADAQPAPTQGERSTRNRQLKLAEDWLPPRRDLLLETTAALDRARGQAGLNLAMPGTDGSFAQYLLELRQFPILSPDAECQLGFLSRMGRSEAVDALVLHNLRFVVAVARRYQRNVPIEDLVGEGNLGLIRAVNRFDPAWCVRLLSYANHYIDAAMRTTLAEQHNTLRLPAHRASQVSRLHKLRIELTNEMGRKPTTEELAVVLDISPEVVERLLAVSRSAARLDEGGNIASPADEAHGAASFSPSGMSVMPTAAQNAELTCRRETLERAMHVLDDRERQILTLFYGLRSGREYTLGDIGILLGITRERVRQLRDRALGRLRESDAASSLADYHSDQAASQP